MFRTEFSASVLSILFVAFPLELNAHQSLSAQITDGKLIHVDTTPRWCGAKALWHLLTAYGCEAASFGDVLAACEATDKQTETGSLSLQQLALAAQHFGFKAAGYRCDSVFDLGMPVITVHRIPSADGKELYHARVMLSFNNSTVYFIDPFHPARLFSASIEEYEATWTFRFLAVLPKEGLFWEDSICTGLIVVLTSLCGILSASLVFSRRLELNCLLFSISLVAVCGCANDSEPTSDLPAPSVDPIVFKTKTLQSDASVLTGELAKGTFSFRNMSGNPVRIRGINTSCSCIVGNYPDSSVLSGEESEITLQVDGRGRMGEFLASARVIFETESTVVDGGWEPLTPVTLALAVKFVPDVIVSPSSVTLANVLVGEEASAVVTVTRLHTAPAPSILQLRADTDRFSISGVENEFQAKGNLTQTISRFEVKYTPQVAGLPETGVIVVHDGRYQTVAKIPVFGRAEHPDLTVSPSALVLVGHDSSTSLVFTPRDSKETPVIMFSVDDPEVKCMSSNEFAGSYTLKFSLSDTHVFATPHVVKTYLRAATTNPSDPSILIPLILVPRKI